MRKMVFCSAASDEDDDDVLLSRYADILEMGKKNESREQSSSGGK